MKIESSTTIIVADDHPLFRGALRQALGALFLSVVTLVAADAARVGAVEIAARRAGADGDHGRRHRAIAARVEQVEVALEAGHGARPARVLAADPAKAAESIKRFSEKDAANWLSFIGFMKKVTKFMHSANSKIMPRLPMGFNFSEGMDLAKLGIDLRMFGGPDMMRIIRGIPMTADEFVDEWFESDVVKAAVASIDIHGITLGTFGAGTGYTLMHNWANRGGMSHISVNGGVGKITEALANAVKTLGGEIRTGLGGGEDEVVDHAEQCIC